MSRVPVTVMVHQALAKVEPQALTCSDIAARVEVDLRSVRRAMVALTADGLVRRHGRRQRHGGFAWRLAE